MVLSFDDKLPTLPERVLIAGVTGSGKTTLARRIGVALNLPHIEIDALFHGPNWVPRPEFIDDVAAFAAEHRWITEWQYVGRGTAPILAPRAQLVLWLDYPYRIVRTRLIRRTLSRSILRTKMWNDNVEAPLWKLTFLSNDAKKNLLQWQTDTLHIWDERMPLFAVEYPHLTIVRLKHPRETEAWLRANL